MAGKSGTEYPLSIVLRAVDKATAPIKAAAASVDRALEPVRKASSRLGQLWGSDAFKGLGDALSKAGRAAGDLAVKMGVLAGAAGLAARSLVEIYGQGDDLGDLADRLGMSVDAVQQLRYAGKRTGIEFEAMSTGLETFSKNVGEAKTGMGRMTTFLGKASPALLKQVKGAKSVEEAFTLMAKAAAKIEDPMKRAKFAQAVFGDAKFALLLERGEEGIAELRARYMEIAGPQAAFAKSGSEVSDSLDDLEAGWQGVKAAIAVGLAPAFLKLATDLRAFFAENRDKIEAFARNLGEKLPGAIDKAVDAGRKVYGIFREVWDLIGGAEGAVYVMVAAITGPFITSILGVVAALWKVVAALRAGGAAAGAAQAAAGGGAAAGAGGAALPGAAKAAGGGLLGFLGAAALPVAATGLATHYLGSKLGAKERGERAGYLLDRPALDAEIQERAGKGNELGSWGRLFEAQIGAERQATGQPSLALPAAGADGRGGKLEIEIKGAPAGTRATMREGGEDVDLSVGYQLAGAGL